MAKQRRKAPEPIQAMFQRSLTLMQQGDNAQAERLLSDLLTRDPQHVDSLHLLGLSHLRRKAWESGWRDLPAKERAKYLYRIARLLQLQP